MKMIRPILLFTILWLSLVGCGSDKSSPSITPQKISPTVTNSTVATGYPMGEGYPAGVGYPGPGNPTQEVQMDTGYPPPESTPAFAELPDTLVVPTPSAETGVIIGQLLSPGPGGKPYYTTLYLARTIEADNKQDLPPMLAFSAGVDPIAVQDKTGKFLFSEVQPGKYALVIWSPVSSTAITQPGSKDYLIFEVKAGEVKDLGVIGIP